MIIFKTKFGSHLYGTETEHSDVDWKGVYIPDARDILLGRSKGTIDLNEKVDHRTGLQRKNYPGETDFELYSLQKFMSLAAEGQLPALDMLFATPLVGGTDIDGVMSDIWIRIWENRDKLACNQTRVFFHYAYHQASKYGVKGSRMAAAEKAAEFFAELAGNLGSKIKLRDIDVTLTEAFEDVPHCSIVEIKQVSGEMMKAFECCGRKVMWNVSLKTARDIYTKLFDDYGHRARKAKNNQGVDWKALSHAVRVGREAVEYLRTGFITFPRPEAQRLVMIKRGEMDYQKVAEEIEQLLDDVRDAADKSDLPDEPDYQWIDDFVTDVYTERVKDWTGE